MLASTLLAVSLAAGGAGAGPVACEVPATAPKAIHVVPMGSPIIDSRLPRGVDEVEVILMVGADGKPYDISVVDEALPGSFKQAATRAASEWRFTPATECGQALARQGSVVIPVIAEDPGMRIERDSRAPGSTLGSRAMRAQSL